MLGNGFENWLLLGSFNLIPYWTATAVSLMMRFDHISRVAIVREMTQLIESQHRPRRPVSLVKGHPPPYITRHVFRLRDVET